MYLLKLFIISVSIFLFHGGVTGQETFTETATDTFGNRVTVERHKLTGVASRIWNSNPNFGFFMDSSVKELRGNEIDEPLIRKHAKNVIKYYHTLLGICPNEFTLRNVESDGEFWFISFDQVYRGILVHNGRFGFTLNQDGNIISIGSDGYPGIELSVTAQLSVAEVVESAKQRFNVDNRDNLELLSEPVLMIYPRTLKNSLKHHLTYKIEIGGKVKGDRRRLFLDANTSEVLFDKSLFKDGNWTVNGNVKGQYWPVNSGGSQQEAFPKYLTAVKVYNSISQEISSDVIDGSGNYSMSGNHAYQTFFVEVELRGSWSKIKNPSSQVDMTKSFVTSGNHSKNFNFSDTDDGFHVYHHMNVIHDFIKGYPFYYNGMDWQMEARVNYQDYEHVSNAGADGSKLYFSDNNRNWWESSDVVYHEYTHNIVHDIYGSDIGSSGGAMGDAMDEGIADYFAATLNQNSAIDWVGRNISNTLMWPNNYNAANPHYSGQILSGAMWDLESTISKNTARKLNFKAMRITPRPDTFVEFVNNVILADDNNGTLCDLTPHTDEILAAFQNKHGIAPSILPDFYVIIDGPGDIEPETSETWTAEVCGGSGSISYQWYVKYQGSSTWNSLGTSQNQSHAFYNNNTTNELKVEVTQGSDSDECIFSVNVFDGVEEKKIALGEIARAQILLQFNLQQNYPNPFNPTTEIKYGLPVNGLTTLEIFNLRGQKVRTLVNEKKSAGYHHIVWDGRDDFGNSVASGVYIYRIHVLPNQNGDLPFESIKKMTFLR